MYQKFQILLDQSGETAYQVAKKTGISTATLSSWKKGRYCPKVDKLNLLANHFGVTIEYFLTEEA